MNRLESLARVTDLAMCWDVAVIGGGATGMGIALDAAARGYATCLFEQADFGKGTSSRSTKLIHGGVRYLRQGNVSLVKEALKERGILRKNAPHLVHDLAFIVPNYAWWEKPYYAVGLRVYDLLAGRLGFGRSQRLSNAELLAHIPTLDTQGLKGGVLYYDGQFDDARLLIDLAHTAAAHGAALLNYAPVTGLSHDARGQLRGLTFVDAETDNPHALHARCVINAAGPFSDAIRRQDDPAAAPAISASQGAHVVLDRSFLPGDAAIMVPRTADGRVLFLIPWHGHTLLGTTETAIDAISLEPVALDAEIDFILDTASRYLSRHPTRADILSVFAGIRPLAHEHPAGHTGKTASLSREHAIDVAPSGLISVTGGKWTTYRRMAEEAVDCAAAAAHLETRPCMTRDLTIHGATADTQTSGDLWYYGSAAAKVRAIMETSPALAAQLHPALPIFAAQVLYAAQTEMARTVEDVLARRTRALFLNARAAVAMAPAVAKLLAAEFGREEAWELAQVREFEKLAAGYLPHGASVRAR